jgi:uncharacterized protein (TIGR02594 family)
MADASETDGEVAETPSKSKPDLRVTSPKRQLFRRDPKPPAGASAPQMRYPAGGDTDPIEVAPDPEESDTFKTIPRPANVKPWPSQEMDGGAPQAQQDPTEMNFCTRDDCPMRGKRSSPKEESAEVTTGLKKYVLRARKKKTLDPTPPKNITTESTEKLSDADRKSLPHMVLARSQLGTKEEPGDDDDNPEVQKYFKSTSLGMAQDSVPWCAAFVGYCLSEAGTPGSGGANARSYMQWGKATKKPQYGDVVVFWRGSKDGWLGHVAFFVEDQGDTIKVLGGNQHDCVCYAEYAKDHILGYRTISHWGNSKTVKAAVLGFVAVTPLVAPAALTFALPPNIITETAAQQVTEFAASLPGMYGTALGILGQLMFVYIAYERIRKQKTVGV